MLKYKTKIVRTLCLTLLGFFVFTDFSWAGNVVYQDPTPEQSAAAATTPEEDAAEDAEAWERAQSITSSAAAANSGTPSSSTTPSTTSTTPSTTPSSSSSTDATESSSMGAVSGSGDASSSGYKAGSWNLNDDKIGLNIGTDTAGTTSTQAKLDGEKGILGLIEKAVNFILLISGTVAIFVLIAAGFIMIISGGSSKLLDQAKGMFAGALIGLVVVFCAYLIVAFVQMILYNTAYY